MSDAVVPTLPELIERFGEACYDVGFSHAIDAAGSELMQDEEEEREAAHAALLSRVRELSEELAEAKSEASVNGAQWKIAIQERLALASQLEAAKRVVKSGIWNDVAGIYSVSKDSFEALEAALKAVASSTHREPPK